VSSTCSSSGDGREDASASRKAFRDIIGRKRYPKKQVPEINRTTAPKQWHAVPLDRL
jgi:hypothetical protein